MLNLINGDKLDKYSVLELTAYRELLEYVWEKKNYRHTVTRLNDLRKLLEPRIEELQDDEFASPYDSLDEEYIGEGLKVCGMNF